ncbi:MAG: hypothetical protein IPL26_02345 [Leptospiraceae bacterium]|nr:hypothetical protein [Leptospiraceae bacterium]
MTTTPRKFDSEIRISENGEWIFRGQLVTQENILSFFKKNIKEDEHGIYITNSYGTLTEHGYLETKCIFLKVTNYDIIENEIYLTTEDDTNLPISNFLFYSDKNEKIFCARKSDKFIKFNFNRQVHSYLSNFLIEDNGNYFLEINETKIPIIPSEISTVVKIPEAYTK